MMNERMEYLNLFSILVYLFIYVKIFYSTNILNKRFLNIVPHIELPYSIW